jgi:uncharacterized protein YndB with AHSA1/START domain
MPSRSATRHEIAIAAAAETVWSALTQPTGRLPWMNRAEVRSAWTAGALVEIDVVLEGQLRHDRGMVEAVDKPRLLRYSLWTEVSRRRDTPENRSRVTFTLEPLGQGTKLIVEHDGLIGAAGPHAGFFWSVALRVLRDQLEGRQAPMGIDIL